MKLHKFLSNKMQASGIASFLFACGKVKIVDAFDKMAK